jgi:hypothetical protein
MTVSRVSTACQLKRCFPPRQRQTDDHKDEIAVNRTKDVNKIERMCVICNAGEERAHLAVRRRMSNEEEESAKMIDEMQSPKCPRAISKL